MRRYGIARYLTDEQKQRAASATYRRVPVENQCERGDCWHLGPYVQAIRSVGSEVCPIGVAFCDWSSPDPWEFEATVAKSCDGSNLGALRAAQRFMHDVDSGKIGPADVAVALGLAATQQPAAAAEGEGNGA